ncbi:MAG: glycerophosphodiester phosphodiesterase family protein [Armatimonadia bacterium]
MWIACWNCGQDVWFETQTMCRHCDAPTRRCADCINYEAKTSTCLDLNIDVAREDAENPSRLSLSMTCASYGMTDQAAMRQGAAVAKAPATPAAPAAPQAPAAPAPQASGTDEYITIRREPPLKRPRHPVVIAHRGDSAAAPENTLSAFTSAVQSGAHAIEFDVHVTADGHPVVIHDATVDRVTNGSGAVADMTLAQIKALDAGGWFAGPYEGEQIPTLDEAIEALPAPTALFVHLRAHENASDRWERAVVEAIGRRDARKRTAITNHTRHGLQRIRELDPKIRLCWIPVGGQPGQEYIDDTYLLGCRFLQPRLTEIDEAFVAYAHEKDLWVNAFWADTEEDMQRMIALGVDGIITNYPRRLRELLR